jgi:outer membrane protein OmpA-like peptidoglycan-associated protein
MVRAHPLAFYGLAALILAAGCASKKTPPSTPVAAPPPALILLLPDPETNITGRARVSNEFGSTNLTTARAASRVTANAAPGAVTTFTDAEVTKLFGAALAALPPAPRHFTLQFRFESDVLTAESTALIPEILQAVKALAVPEVVVVGHTDTMGDPKSNVALGLKRAGTVRAILIQAGLPTSTIDVRSHGEADLLVKTRNNVPEPRNRRVEITVR